MAGVGPASCSLLQLLQHATGCYNLLQADIRLRQPVRGGGDGSEKTKLTSKNRQVVTVYAKTMITRENTRVIAETHQNE